MLGFFIFVCPLDVNVIPERNLPFLAILQEAFLF